MRRASIGGVTLVALLCVAGMFAFAQDQPPERPRPAVHAPAPPPPQVQPPGEEPQGQPPPPPGRRGGPPAWDGPTVRLDATVYRVTLPVGAVGQLDGAALTAKAASVAEFAKALEAIGATTLLYRVDQVVAAANPAHIDIDSSVPYVTGESTLPGGQTSSSVARQKVGLTLEWTARMSESGPPPKIDAAVNLELSFTSDSRIQTGGSARAPIFRSVRQRFTTPFVTDKPFVLISSETPAADDGKVDAIVTRFVIRAIPQ
jgi:hypothetical protein